eukprot:12642088-Alexandrium_andersonii.AAC.1
MDTRYPKRLRPTRVLHIGVLAIMVLIKVFPGGLRPPGRPRSASGTPAGPLRRWLQHLHGKRRRAHPPELGRSVLRSFLGLRSSSFEHLKQVRIPRIVPSRTKLLKQRTT